METGVEAYVKRHTACDECRTRKLKCSGEPVGCVRCIKQQIQCHYSIQKQMGRPRKRQKIDERSHKTPSLPYGQEIPPTYQKAEGHQPTSQTLPLPEQPGRELPIDPSLAAIDQDRTKFTNICNGPNAQSIRQSRGTNILEQQVAYYHSNVLDSLVDNDGVPSRHISRPQYPLDIASWPDFSTFNSPGTLLRDPNFTGLSSLSPPYTTSVDGTYHDPDADLTALHSLPAIPACPCLPNLYLALSTLSTSAAFPTSSHTIETLLAAQKTAYSVIYCPVCPQKFQSGSQNLMLSCTLLNVMADHWHRMRRCSTEDLKKGFGKDTVSNESLGHDTFVSVREGQAWRDFAHNLVRAYVFGDKPIPHPPPPPSQAITPTPDTTNTGIIPSNKYPSKTIPKHYVLSCLIDAIRRRQRQWHNLDEPTDEFPDRAHCAYPQLYKSHQNHEHGPRKPSDDDEGGKEQERRRSDAGDHALCLMIVKHSMELVKTLDDTEA